MVMDHENGSWFHQLDEQNHLKGTVWPGKSDLYHALQSTLIPYHKADNVYCTGSEEKTGDLNKIVLRFLFVSM
mgnify:FL=1